MANKRYDQFGIVSPTSTRITLTADPATGALGKCTVAELQPVIPILNPDIAALQLLGSTIINFCVGWQIGGGKNAQGLGVGQGFFNAIYLPAGTVTGFTYILATAGVFTGNNFNGFGLYSLAGTTLTKVAETANDPNIFKGTINAWRTVAMTSTHVITAGVYYIVSVHSASAVTTSPTLYGASFTNVDVTSLGAPGNTHRICYYVSSVTSMAATFSTASFNGISSQLIGVGIY